MEKTLIILNLKHSKLPANAYTLQATLKNARVLDFRVASFLGSPAPSRHLQGAVLTLINEEIRVDKTHIISVHGRCPVRGRVRALVWIYGAVRPRGVYADLAKFISRVSGEDPVTEVENLLN